MTVRLAITIALICALVAYLTVIAGGGIHRGGRR